MTSIDNYIHFFSTNNKIRFTNSANDFTIITENNELIAYFSDDAVIIKLYDSTHFYALKCFSNNTSQEQHIIYDKNSITDTTEELPAVLEQALNIIDNEGSEYNVKPLLTEWIDDSLFLNCTNRFIKKLHHNESNIAYKKVRKKIKAAVVVSLSTVLAIITGVKIVSPNAILVNPIDYRQLIVDDSIRTVSIALNNNKIPAAPSEIKIITKPIEIQTITDLLKVDNTFVKKVPASKIISEKNKIKNKKNKSVASLSDSKKAKNRNKKAELNAVKVINTKGTVTFRSTDF